MQNKETILYWKSNKGVCRKQAVVWRMSPHSVCSLPRLRVMCNPLVPVLTEYWNLSISIWPSTAGDSRFVQRCLSICTAWHWPISSEYTMLPSERPKRSFACPYLNTSLKKRATFISPLTGNVTERTFSWNYLRTLWTRNSCKALTIVCWGDQTHFTKLHLLTKKNWKLVSLRSIQSIFNWNA